MIRIKEDWYDEWGLERPDNVPTPKNVKLYDVVKCVDYEWFVIKIEDDVVTLLAKNADFGRYEFDKISNEYKTSEIRKYLENKVLPKLQNANPIPTRLRGVGCTDRVWLLSTKEAEKLPKNIRQFPRWYWLRTPGSEASNYAAYVYNDGSVYTNGTDVHYVSGCIRPAMRVDLAEIQ